jgi:heme exporter protein CcmD
MSEFFAMDGDGPYVWAAYGITLVVLIWNIWAARYRLKRNLRAAALDAETAEPARRPKVSQL